MFDTTHKHNPPLTPIVYAYHYGNLYKQLSLCAMHKAKKKPIKIGVSKPKVQTGNEIQVCTMKYVKLPFVDLARPM